MGFTVHRYTGAQLQLPSRLAGELGEILAEPVRRQSRRRAS